MQRNTRTTFNQPNKSTPAQANRTTSVQSRAVSSPVNSTPVSQAGRAGNQSSGTSNVNPVVCRKCKSPQIVANKRGYNFASMFKTLGWMALLPILLLIGALLLIISIEFGSGRSSIVDLVIKGLGVIGIICWISISLSLPVSILVGFVGRSEIVNGCMNCGFKWTPARRK